MEIPKGTTLIGCVTKYFTERLVFNVTKEKKEKMFKNFKDTKAKVAKELYYGKVVESKILNAKTKEEVYLILTTARQEATV